MLLNLRCQKTSFLRKYNFLIDEDIRNEIYGLTKAKESIS